MQYSSNRFALVDATKQDDSLQVFLDRIGSANASSLSYLTMGFPAVERISEEPGKARLHEEGLTSLALLRERCTGLTTLQAMVRSEQSSGLSKENQDDLPFIRDALSQIDTHMRAIPSLRNILVRIYGVSLNSRAVELMQGLGWAVFLGDMKKPVE